MFCFSSLMSFSASEPRKKEIIVFVVQFPSFIHSLGWLVLVGLGVLLSIAPSMTLKRFRAGYRPKLVCRPEAINILP